MSFFQFYVKSHTPSLASSQEESVAESLNLQIEALKEEFNAQIKGLMIKLDEERRRNICLEEQIQYLTDLHQKVCNNVIHINLKIVIIFLYKGYAITEVRN